MLWPRQAEPRASSAPFLSDADMCWPASGSAGECSAALNHSINPCASVRVNSSYRAETKGPINFPKAVLLRGFQLGAERKREDGTFISGNDHVALAVSAPSDIFAL